MGLYLAVAAMIFAVGALVFIWVKPHRLGQLLSGLMLVCLGGSFYLGPYPRWLAFFVLAVGVLNIAIPRRRVKSDG